MNIIDFIKGLFKSKTIDTYNIISINDIVQIPKRDKLSKEQVILLDKYKQEYSKILSNKKVFSSKDLTIGSFNEDIDINIHLLLNICINDKEKNSFGVQRKENNIDLMIKILKLKLCQNSLSNMETEIITRIISLKEIYKEKKYLISFNKRNSIDSEINNLTNTIVIYLNQKNAIQIEIDAYLDSIETLSSSNTISKSDEDKYLIDRKNELLEMISIVMDEVPSIIEGNIKLEIAQLERILEIYVYNHKEDIKKIDKELELLSKDIKSVSNREMLLEQITRLEFKYRIFDEFGRHIVTEEQINNLYRVKFDILTIDINNRRESPINKKTNSKELEVYKQVVMEKIEKIVTGNNKYISLLFGSNSSKRIADIIKILKDGDRKFDYNKILSDTLLLSLLLSFDGRNGFKKLYKEYKVNKSEVDYVDFHEEICKWEDELSLDTIYKLISNDKDLLPLFKLYYHYIIIEMFSKKSYIFTYEFLEGLIELNIPEYQIQLKVNDSLFLEQIKSNCDRKQIIILPSSMRKITGNVFGKCSINEIRLNEGLEYIGHDVFKSKNLGLINIPSTLKEFPRVNKVDVIEFDNFENSKILNNTEELDKFISKYFYRVPRFDFDFMGNVIDIHTFIKRIIFSSKEVSKKVNIDLNDLGLVFDPLPWLEESGFNDIHNTVKKKVEEKIKSETGYDFKLTRKK